MCGMEPSEPMPLPSDRPWGSGTTLGSTTTSRVTAHRGGAQGEPERVAHAHPERADAVHAAGVRPHGVLHLLHVAGSQRRKHSKRGRSPSA